MAQVQTGHKEWYVRMNSGNGLYMELANEAHNATGESEGTNMESLVRFVAEAESRTSENAGVKAVFHSSVCSYKMIV